MIASTTSTTSCCASCTSTSNKPASYSDSSRRIQAARFEQTKRDHAPINTGHHGQHSVWTDRDDTQVIYSSGLGTLYDRRRRHHRGGNGTIHWPFRRGGGGPANVAIHHQASDFQQEKQPPLDRYQSNTLGSRSPIEQQQQEQEAPTRKPHFLHLSLLRRRRTTPEKKSPTRQQLTMGQRFGRQQVTSIPEVKTPDENKSISTAAPVPGSSSLRLPTGQQRRLPIPQQWSAMSGCGGNTGPWWACAPLNGAISANDHYYHQYLSRQPYATIVKNRVPNGGAEKTPTPTLQERQQYLRDLMIGDRLANFYDEPSYGVDRQTSPCRQIVDARSGFDLLPRRDKRQWAEIPATPRLVRTNKVRQQTTSPLASTPLLQKRHQQNGGNYWPGDEYAPSGAFTSTPSYPPSPALRRTGPLGQEWTDSRAQSTNGREPTGLEPPPPTPEEAEDCLAAHLRIICHEQAAQWNRKQHQSPFEYEEHASTRLLGSTDVLLNSPHSSQHSVLQTSGMPSSRHPVARAAPQQHLYPPSSSGLRQSQESLMSLMSTSTTSMAVAPGPHLRSQHYQHQHAGGSSVGSQSPSVLVRGAHYGRHSHNYGGHRAAPSSSCGSSSRGSSECSFNIIGQRRHVYRRSARNLNVRIPYLDNESAGQNNGQKSTGGSSIVLKGLKPLPFEVPCVDSAMDTSTIFIGREWIFHELYEILVKSTSTESHGMKGAVIYGGVGTGKTAVIHQLASYSPFLVGEDHEDDLGHDSPSISPYCANGSPNSDRTAQGMTACGQPNRTSNSTDSGFVSGSKLSLNNKNGVGGPSVPVRHIHQQPPPRPPLPDWHRSVCQAVVAYHFCQIENQVTCHLADFLRNLASMFACSPQLVAYREFLHQQPKLQRLLTSGELLKNPARAFRSAVTEPLMHLRKCGKIGNGNYLILIDGLDEAEFHRPEFGDSIGSFLVKHAMSLLPDWLKLVLTAKTASVDLLKGLPLHKINLDDIVIDEWVFKDSKEYIRLRIGQSSTIQTNISNTKAPSSETGPAQVGVPTTASTPDGPASCPLARFAGHLASGSKGNFLYMKLTLNLIEKNYLVMKGANYKVLPINLAEVFLLMFNLRFPTARAFERVAPILNVVLASLKPLTADEIYQAVAAGMINERLTMEDFQERLKVLEDYLVKKQDGTHVLFHPAFRDWLIRREDGQSPKYLCDMRYGHALLALRLSRSGRRLNAGEMLELGHHLLKAHIYKRGSTNQKRTDGVEETDFGAAAALFGRDCQLLWLNQVASDLRSALCTERNACYPNSKVSRLLLLAGASADAQLANFRLDDAIDQNDEQQTPTDKRATADHGTTPILCSAAFYGQQEFATLLLEFGADVGATESYKGRSPLMLAAAEGHLDMVQMLHQHGAKLSQIDNDHRCALVYAAERGQTNVVSFLLQCDWTELSETRMANGDMAKANMASSTYGNALRQQAAQQAFVAAGAAGRTSVCEFLLDFGDVMVDEADPVGGETALSAACASARKETVGFLLNRAGARAAYGRQSEKPTPPLLQAVANGCWENVSTLLARQMDVDGERNGAGQTALMVAAQFGHIAVLELLLSRNVDVSATDDDNRTALYWACLKDQPAVANLLLDRGASLETFDKHGFGPIHYAAQHGSKQLMQLLLDRCPQLLEVPTNSSSRLRPLDLAILADNVDAVQRCLKKGAKLAPSTWTFARDKLSMIAALLNKLLEDGQLLYKRNRLEDAQHRFTYALKKLPPPPSSGSGTDSPYAAQWLEYGPEFDRLRFHLQLNYARCQRKSGDASKAAETCTDAIRTYQQALLSSSPRRQMESEQSLVDAYVCRARCFCELRQFEKASEDLRRALRVSPTNREAQQLLPKVKMALEKDTGGGIQKETSSKNKIEISSGSSLLSVYSPPQSSRESSLPAITDTEASDPLTKNGTGTACSSASPNRSQASSDSGNMPDMEDGENMKGRFDLDLRKRENGVETQL